MHSGVVCGWFYICDQKWHCVLDQGRVGLSIFGAIIIVFIMCVGCYGKIKRKLKNLFSNLPLFSNRSIEANSMEMKE